MSGLLACIRRRATGVTAAVFVAAVSPAATDPPPLLLANARIYTGTEHTPPAGAVLAVNGRIAYVGSEAGARQHAPAGVQIIDLGGRTLLPGFTDAHAHLAGIGFRELGFNLEGTASVDELQARLQRRAAELPPGTWLVGRGWIESQWNPARFPNRRELDAVVADRPVFLSRADGHAAVVNSRALELARIGTTTPNPPGGEILRDAQGEPTGMLVDKAMDLVRRLVPPPSEAETLQALRIGGAHEVRLGWTQVHVAGASSSELGAMRRLVGDGGIKLRLYVAASGPGAAAESVLAQGPASTPAARFTARGIKLYIDGALGSRGAALLEPYSDAPASTGLLMNSEQTLLPLLVRALRRGIQIQTHAIGDRGNRLVLDLYEKAFAAVPPAERAIAAPRWRIEHAQVVHPDDQPRFAKLGVIASMQPSHAIGDLYFAPNRLGSARVGTAYAWRSLLDAGTTIAGGSDAPVERGEPQIEFYAAVTRRGLNGFASADWHPEQRVTRAEALKMFTLWPAFASFEEDQRGTIEPGKVADFTAWSADLMTIPEPEILRARCVMTVIGGEVVWSEL